MAVTLTPRGKTPGQTQFGLDTFTEHYKCDATADVVLTDPGVPQIGAAHPDYAFMFITNRYCSETSESASALDLVYTGCLLSADDAPVFPAFKRDNENAVQSASSSRGSDGTIALSPVSIQFYAPTNVYTYISIGAPGGLTAADPVEDLTLIAITIGDTSLTPSSVPDLVALFFQEQILETHNATEIVQNQYWLNVSRKIKSYVAFVLALTPGAYISLGAGGGSYFVGNTLTISAGGETATMDIDTLGVGNSVGSFTVTSNTFTVPQTLLTASGGSGSGARFNVIIVT